VCKVIYSVSLDSSDRDSVTWDLPEIVAGLPYSCSSIGNDALVSRSVRRSMRRASLGGKSFPDCLRAAEASTPRSAVNGMMLIKSTHWPFNGYSARPHSCRSGSLTSRCAQSARSTRVWPRERTKSLAVLQTTAVATPAAGGGWMTHSVAAVLTPPSFAYLGGSVCERGGHRGATGGD
jgi:hypothetical protein